MDDFIHREILIRKLLFLREIIFQRCSKFRGATVKNGRSGEYPFILRDVVISNASGMRINAGEQFPVNREILIRRKAKGTFGENHGNSSRNLIGLFRTVCGIPRRIFLVIGLQKCIGFFKGNLSFDISIAVCTRYSDVFRPSTACRPIAVCHA